MSEIKSLSFVEHSFSWLRTYWWCSQNTMSNNLESLESHPRSQLWQCGRPRQEQKWRAIHSYRLLLGHLCPFQRSLGGYSQPSTFCTNLKSKQEPSMQSKVILFHLFQQKWVFNQRRKLSNKINGYFERVCYWFLIIKGSNYSWCLDHRLNQAF